MKKLLILLFSSLLFAGCSTEKKSEVSNSNESKSSQSSKSSSSSSKKEKTRLESLQGTWKNARGESFTISNKTINFNNSKESSFNFNIDSETNEVIVDSPYLGFLFTEAGESIPASEDYASSSYIIGTDTTDQTKDRFLIGQDSFISDEVDEYIYYKE